MFIKQICEQRRKGNQRMNGLVSEREGLVLLVEEGILGTVC